jgi:hypothetical protein
MAYFLFLLVNAALFLRPTELIPQLEDKPLYEMFIVPCLVIALPRVVSQLTPQSLYENPITACVVGLMGALVISAVLSPNSEEALPFCFTFAKVVCYYLLLVAVVDTPGKLRGFLYYLGGLVFTLAVLALLQYHGAIDIPALASQEERQWEFVDEKTGERGEVLVRLQAAGIYNNPNDLSRILLVGIFIGLYGWGDRQLAVLRPAWIVLLGVLAYAFALTHSRGGFLGLLAGVLAVLWGRFGAQKTIALAVMVLPFLILGFSGRQTSIQVSEGTGLLRIKLWSDAFEVLRDNPLFGVGLDMSSAWQPNTHNSFVQVYRGLGLIGGTLFIGAFYLAILLPFRVGMWSTALPEGELRRFRPYLLAILAGYVIGMFSSSRNAVAPTYMLVGLTTVYMQFACAYLPVGYMSLSTSLVRQLVLVNMLVVVALYLFIRISVGQT